MKGHFGLFFDGSASSQKALDQALFLMEGKPHASLHILHCVPLPNIDPPFGFLADEAEKHLKKEKEKAAPLLQKLQTKLEDKEMYVFFPFSIVLDST